MKEDLNSILRNAPDVIDLSRPRMQIIRGIPGCGKSTLAKQYPCIHLELDQFCCRRGAYRWGESRDKIAQEWLQVQVHRYMKEGFDIVVSGVFCEMRKRLGWLLYWGQKCGYECWVQDLTEIKGNGTVHAVRFEDQDRFARLFEPFDKEKMAHVNRYGREKDEIRMSENEAAAFEAYVFDHVHVGLMPKEYPNEPEMDGLGA